MKHVFITGGAGFIGSHTVDFLLEKGLRVTVYDNLSTGKLSYLNVFHPNLTFIQADILDYAKLRKEIARCDTVLHLAALPSVPKSIEDPILSHNVNLLGFLNVLQAIREIDQSIRLVYASSAAVYGNPVELPCQDDANLANALSPYALEKATNERYADLYLQLFGLKSLGLRYFNVYGARQDPDSPYSGVISRFLALYQQREPITIFGDGEQSRDFIYVADVAQANFLALQNPYCGVLNIATGKAETLKNLVHYIEEAGGIPAQLTMLPRRPGDISHSYAQVEQAKHALSFEAKTPLARGIYDLMG